MFTYIANTIGFTLIALGAYQGLEAFMHVNATAEPLAFALMGAFILMTTTVGGFNDAK